MSSMNKRIRAMECIKCHKELPVGDYLYGCPYCGEKGENASVSFRYEGYAGFHPEYKGMKRYMDFLPYEDFPTLGEGNTPLTRLPILEKKLGLGVVYSKNEFQNPTGSHKDRMNPMIVARAKKLGAKVVACASSGNEGVSLAAYAARANLECVIVTTFGITDIWKSAMIAAGAQVVLVEKSSDRLLYLKDKIENEGWYCATNQLDVPVGSCAYGIQGYKTISYELYEELSESMPDYILVPTCRGDLLYGIYEGFRDLKDQGMLQVIPKLVAVEPFSRLEQVLKGSDYRLKFEGDSGLTPSIGGMTATYQSKKALDDSRGFAVSIGQDRVVDNILELARQGLYLEASSALNYGCLSVAIEQGKIELGSSVVLISTSHGFKNRPEFFEREDILNNIKQVGGRKL